MMPIKDMMTKDNFVERDIQTIDFIEQYNKNLTSLLTLLNVFQKTELPIGTLIKTYKTKVTKASGDVAQGEDIPLSKVERKVGDTFELKFSKHRKLVPVELIQEVGFENAIVKSDEALLRELQKEIRDNFVDFLKKGTGTASGAGFQQACANAWAKVITAFPEDDVDVIAFINPMDISKYLGTAPITTQSAFGMTYIENFMSFRTVFMHNSIAEGSFYATASQNLNFAYAKINGEINKEFDFKTDKTGIIGVTHDRNTTNLTAQTVTLSANVLFAELMDGVVKATITGV